MGCPDCHGQPHTRETGLTGFLEEVKKGGGHYAKTYDNEAK